MHLLHIRQCTSCASGNSTSAEPPPESKKKHDRVFVTVSSARKNRFSGLPTLLIGRGVSAYEILHARNGRKGGVARKQSVQCGSVVPAIPRNPRPSRALPCRWQYAHALTVRKSTSVLSKRRTAPSRCSFLCIASGMSIAEMVSWKIRRASSFSSAMREAPAFIISLSKRQGSIYSAVACLSRAPQRFPQPCKPSWCAFRSRRTRCGEPEPHWVA